MHFTFVDDEDGSMITIIRDEPLLTNGIDAISGCVLIQRLLKCLTLEFINLKKKNLEEKEIDSELQKAILRALKLICAQCNPNPYEFGNCNYGDETFLSGVMGNQYNISWTNCTLGRWSPKWK